MIRPAAPSPQPSIRLGVPCLYTEAAGAGRARPQDVDCFTRGVLNVMHHLDMLEGEPAAVPPPQHLLGDGNMDEVMSAPLAGYFRPHVELLQEVQTGQLVGRKPSTTHSATSSPSCIQRRTASSSCAAASIAYTAVTA